MDLEFIITVQILAKTISSTGQSKKLTTCTFANRKIDQVNLSMFQELLELRQKGLQKTNWDYSITPPISLMSTKAKVSEQMLGKFKTYVLSIITPPQPVELVTIFSTLILASKRILDKVDYHNNKLTFTTQTSNIKCMHKPTVASTKSTP
jgi:hypothetical protein